MRIAFAVLGCQFVLATAIPAQHRRVHTVRWWEAALVIGTVGVTSLADRGVDNWVQDHRSPRSDDVARVFRHGGQPELTLGVPAALFIAGVIGRRPALERRGER